MDSLEAAGGEAPVSQPVPNYSTSCWLWRGENDAEVNLSILSSWSDASRQDIDYVQHRNYKYQIAIVSG